LIHQVISAKAATNAAFRRSGNNNIYNCTIETENLTTVAYPVILNRLNTAATDVSMASFTLFTGTGAHRYKTVQVLSAEFICLLFHHNSSQCMEKSASWLTDPWFMAQQLPAPASRHGWRLRYMFPRAC
jgi:hypothetical protein